MNRFLEKDLYVKIFALFLALLLWLYVLNEQSPRIQRTFTVSLEPRNVAEDLVVERIPSLVEVRVSGLRNNVLGLEAKNVKAYLDLQGTREGEYSLPVRVQIPRNVELLQTRPDRVTIELERVVSKSVAVRPQIKGTVLDRYAVVGAATQVKEAVVVGPRSRVDQVASILAVVHLNEVRGNIQAKGKLVPVNRQDQLVKGLQVRPESTTVTIPTQPVKEVSVRARLRGTPGPGFVVRSVTLTPLALRIAGEAGQLERIGYLETENIDLTGLDSNLQKDVVVTVPGGITLVDRNRVRVLVVLGATEEQRNFSEIPISLQNLPAGWQAKLKPDQVDLMVRGSREALDQLEAENIKVTIDAGAVDREGEFNLVPKVSLPLGLTLKQINPSEVVVNVKKNN